MSESVKIILPLPPACLSPNCPPGSIGGRMRKAAVSKKCRRLAKEAALAQDIQTGPWHKATIQATFFHSQKRRRDDDNYIAMLKSSKDGIVDSGLLFDDDSEHLTTLPAKFLIDRKQGRVELVITRSEFS